MTTQKTQAIDSTKLVRSLLRWFRANARDLPWRHTRNPYAIWVSEIMLQQTQVKTVLPYWNRWMQRLPDIQSLARASSDEIHKLWEGLGYYHRVRNMQRAAREIVEKHGGEFPTEFDSIRALPGIGRYTVGAICSIAFNQPTPILDGNVLRVLARLYGINRDPANPATREQLWDLAEQLVQRSAKLRPDRSTLHHNQFACSDFNQSLMELGAVICKPREPQCLACPVSTHCIALQTDRVHDLPFRPRRPPPTARRFLAFVVERQGRILVRKRAEGVINGGLWELPNAEIAHGPLRIAQATKALGLLPAGSQPLCRISHSITRYRFMTEAFRAEASPGFKTSRTIRWVKWKNLDRLAFPSAHKQIIDLLR
jgi:A/G-specific adenine glycosylase